MRVSHQKIKENNELRNLLAPMTEGQKRDFVNFCGERGVAMLERNQFAKVPSSEAALAALTDEGEPSPTERHLKAAKLVRLGAYGGVKRLLGVFPSATSNTVDTLMREFLFDTYDAFYNLKPSHSAQLTLGVEEPIVKTAPKVTSSNGARAVGERKLSELLTLAFIDRDAERFIDLCAKVEEAGL